MGTPARKLNERYTWDQFRTWPEGERWELIGGEAFDMTAAPLVRHQWVVGHLFRHLAVLLDGKRCQAFVSPIDVKFSDEDIVEPDLIVVCNPDQIKRTHIEGAPALVVEILSASTTVHDRIRKFNLYARFGVREYWIVTPYPPLVEVFVLAGDTYRLAAGYEQDDTLKSPTFPDLALPLTDAFGFPLEPGERVEMVKEGRPPYGPPMEASEPAATT